MPKTTLVTRKKRCKFYILQIIAWVGFSSANCACRKWWWWNRLETSKMPGNMEKDLRGWESLLIRTLPRLLSDWVKCMCFSAWSTILAQLTRSHRSTPLFYRIPYPCFHIVHKLLAFLYSLLVQLSKEICTRLVNVRIFHQIVFPESFRSIYWKGA